SVPEPDAVEFFAEGSPEAVIDEPRTAALVDRLIDGLGRRGPLRRVLLVPPDITRLHSGAGLLTCLLYERLRDSVQVAVLPAVGTHAPMTPAEIDHVYPGVPAQCFHAHDWRNGVVALGEVPAGLVREVSEGKLDFPIRVEVDRLLVEEQWDAILSIG